MTKCPNTKICKYCNKSFNKDSRESYKRFRERKFCSNVCYYNDMSSHLTDLRIHKIRGYMKSRCYNKNHHAYEYYGGKGIEVCGRWLGEDGTKNFLNDMYASYMDHVLQHGYENTTIDRIKNSGNYEPNNCKWATYTEQARNRTNNKLSKKDVEKIRKMGKEGISKDKIADKYKCHKRYIYKIINFKRRVYE